MSLRGFGNTMRFLRAESTYEKLFGIRTSAIKESSSEEYHHYQGAGYLALLKILKETVEKTRHCEFIDIGCGKGRVAFVAEYCGYGQITGIELDNELTQEATHNLQTYRLKRSDSKIYFVEANALEYSYANKPAVYFLFNPFNEAVMRQVLKKICSATTSETWFIYMNPQYTQPFSENHILPVKEFKTGRYLEAIVYRLN